MPVDNSTSVPSTGSSSGYDTDVATTTTSQTGSASSSTNTTTTTTQTGSATGADPSAPADQTTEGQPASTTTEEADVATGTTNTEPETPPADSTGTYELPPTDYASDTTSSTSSTAGTATNVATGEQVVVDQTLYDQVQAELANLQQSFEGEEQLPEVCRIIVDTIQTQEETTRSQSTTAQREAEAKRDGRKADQNINQQLLAKQLLTRTPKQLNAMAMQLAKQNPELKNGFSLVARFCSIKMQENALNAGRQTTSEGLKKKAFDLAQLASGLKADPSRLGTHTKVVASQACDDAASPDDLARADADAQNMPVDGDQPLTDAEVEAHRQNGYRKPVSPGTARELELAEAAKKKAMLATPSTEEMAKVLTSLQEAPPDSKYKLSRDQVAALAARMRDGARSVQAGGQSTPGRVASIQERAGQGSRGSNGQDQSNDPNFYCLAHGAAFSSLQLGTMPPPIRLFGNSAMTCEPAVINPDRLQTALDTQRKLARVERSTANLFHAEPNLRAYANRWENDPQSVANLRTTAKDDESDDRKA